MPESPPTPQQTLALILGASEYPLAPNLAHGPAFSNSANDFRRYLMEGLRLPPGNITWLFDDNRSSSDQLLKIGRFLERSSTELMNQRTEPHDLIVYYVGHGLFAARDQAYCLAIRGTKAGSEGLSSIRMSDLADVIKNNARFLRKLLILDCCFSAAAYREFQSGPLQAASRKTLSEFPDRGTTLLCSSCAQDSSLAPQGLPHTMFSDALLIALRKGHNQFGRRISVSELYDLVKLNLRKAYPQGFVRPEVLSPEQGHGDIARIPMFPNAAYGGRATAGDSPVPRTVDDAADERRERERSNTRAREEAERRTREIKERPQPTKVDRLKPKVQDTDRIHRLLLLYRPRGVAGWALQITSYFCLFLAVSAHWAWIIPTCFFWPLAVRHGNKRLEQERLKRRLSELEWQVKNINR